MPAAPKPHPHAKPHRQTQYVVRRLKAMAELTEVMRWVHGAKRRARMLRAKPARIHAGVKPHR